MRPVTTVEEVVIHGHRVRYRTAGEGPVLLLIHGVAGSSQTWQEVMPTLARDHTVIAPDLLGHGESAKPRGDYSLGAYASGLRDLLGILGHDRASVVGHSLGGGIAMIFAYQFPERTERMVLVDSGGLGKEVSIALRAASLPGSEYVLPLLFAPPLLRAGGAVAGVLGKIGLQVGPDVEEIARGIASFHDVGTRTAFVHTVRSVIDIAGQRVSARDRLYLAAGMPTMVIWGERDPIIPVAHGHVAAELMAGCRFEVFPGAGHFPHRDDPMGFADVLCDFLETTEPALITDEVARRLLQERAAA